MQDSYRECGNGGLVPVQCMRYNIPVLDDVLCCRYRFAINDYCSSLYGIFLILLERVLTKPWQTYVIFKRPISKLAGKYIEQFPPPLSLLAVCIIGEMVQRNPL